MLKLATMAAAVVLSAPATAVTYDYAMIAGPGSPFSYGRYDGGTSFTLFTAGCAARPDLPSCYEGPEGAGASQVAFLGGTLIAHPGVSSNTAVIFTAPTTGVYTLNLTIALADPSAGGDGVAFAGFTDDFGSAYNISQLLPPYGGAFSSFNGGGPNLFSLDAGERFAVILYNNGNNNYDSVSFTGSMSTPSPATNGAVPEPATWAMMIGGFALAGTAMRRRKAVVSFA